MSTPTQLGAVFGLILFAALSMVASVAFALVAAFTIQALWFIPALVFGGFSVLCLHRAGFLKYVLRPSAEEKKRALMDAFDKFQ